MSVAVREQFAHVVQFYETEAVLARCVGQHLATTLLRGEPVLVVATPAHAELFAAELRRGGLDVAALKAQGRYVEREAEQVLSAFFRDGAVDRTAFEQVVGGLVQSLADAHGRVSVYGEMVACLWGRGQADAAVELERAWNALADRCEFSLYCAYEQRLLDAIDDPAAQRAVRETHSCVV